MASWREFKAREELAAFLFHEGLPLSWRRFLESGEGVQEEFLKNPYRLVLERGVDFEIIDAFALVHGHVLNDEERLQAGLEHLLREFCQLGHCACPEEKLLQNAQYFLRVERSLLEEILEKEILSERLLLEDIAGTPCLYLPEIWRLERDVARKLRVFRSRPAPWGWMDPHKFLNWAQSLLHVQLAPLQKQAIETALSSSLTVITGGPGTGKTTLIRSLVTILQTQFARFALCTPTGRSAQRLESATDAPASTLHRLLKYNSLTGGFEFHRGHPLNLDLVLVDEMSMVDLSLMSHLLDALPSHCALVLVGDADQIPSIGAGSILQSLIDSDVFSTVRLTEVFRQSRESPIRLNAQKINRGLMPDVQNGGGFHYLPVHGVEETKKVLFDLVTRVIPQTCGIDDPAQVQVLVPLNKGPLGAQQLNQDLQGVLKGGQDPNSLQQGSGPAFRLGDKVMVTRNDYNKGVFNGDIGFIEEIDSFGQKIKVHFEERTLFFQFEELEYLTLAYAITVHKAQGSEYRAVIVVIGPEHLPLAQRHLIYTAITRGKEHVFLVADPRALQKAISLDENKRRWQKLTDLLRASSSHFENEAGLNIFI